MKIQLTILLGLILTTCGTEKTTKLPPDPEAVKYNHLAVDQQQRGNFDSALFFIDRAIQVDSSFCLYYVQRLSFLWALNRNEEALVTAKKISKLRDDNNVSMEGMAYERLGNLEKARELYKQTVDNWPSRELDSHQARIEYSRLVTIIYGKEKGLEELNKIDESKLPQGQGEVIEYVQQSITTYTGTGFLDFKYPNGAPSE